MLLPAVAAPASSASDPDFWAGEPQNVAQRYSRAYRHHNEDWVLSFADTLDMLGNSSGKKEYGYYAAQLRCHHYFNQQDSAGFFLYSEKTRELAYKLGYTKSYFNEMMNVVGYYMNTNETRKAQKMADDIISEAERLGSADGMYIGHYALGTLYGSYGDSAKSTANYLKALRYVDSKSSSRESSMAQIYSLIAFNFFGAKEYDKSLEYCALSEAAGDFDYDIAACRALNHYYMQDYDEFDRRAREYLSKESSNSMSFDYYRTWLQILLHASHHEYDAAIALTEELPDDGDKYSALTEVYRQKGDWETAFRYQDMSSDYVLKSMEEMFNDDMEQMDREMDNLVRIKQKDRDILILRFVLAFAALILLASSLLTWNVVRNHRQWAAMQKRQLDQAERYHALVENAPFGYSKARLIYDSDGKVSDYTTIEINKTLRDSHRSEGHSAGVRTVRQSYPDSSPLLFEQINKALDEKLPYVRFNYHLTEFDRYYETIMLFDGTDVIQIISLNVTEAIKSREMLKEANAELVAAKERAENSDRVKTRFVQNMSHEVRTPLNAIVGFSQLLGLPDGMITEDERREYSSYVASNSDLLTMLINDILDVSDIDSGNYNVAMAPARCNNICASAINTTITRAHPGVQMYYTSELDDDYVTVTDNRRVQQILINFLTNACKNTTSGSIVLHCTDKEVPGKITFSVTDTGCGVPPEKADIIFERFSKLDMFKPGSGLGLNICRDIAERLDGEIGLDKSYVNGARFYLNIPARMKL